MKLRHISSKGTRKNYGWMPYVIQYGYSIGYSKSHKIIFNKTEQENLLAQGKACIYTDNRFYDFSDYINLGVTTKTVKRNASKLVNMSGDDVNFDISNRYCWVNHKTGTKQYPELQLKITLTQDLPEFEKHYGNIDLLTDPKIIELAHALKENGFFFRIHKNTGFLIGEPIDDYIIMAYGENKMIGISEFNHSFRGYGYGCDNILWDFYADFDKWSRCFEIPKTNHTNKIIKILQSKDTPT